MFKRIRIEIKVRNGDSIPLIDGPVVGHRYELDSSPNNSQIVVVVQDDSILLNQQEKVEVFQDQSPEDIATTLFQEYGLISEVDTDQSGSSAAGGLSRYIVQRGTAMHLLRELARRKGKFVYVKPGDDAGQSIGVFKNPDFEANDYPELVLLGEHRNINKFSASLDGFRPVKVKAGNVDITDQTLLSSEVDRTAIDPQGEVAVHDITQVGTTLLARMREEQNDIDSAAQAAVDHSSWAYSANAEVLADNYAAVLSPYKSIIVAGVGASLSGRWLISRVTHTISDENYKQQLTLKRNAQSSSDNGIRDLSGGIF